MKVRVLKSGLLDTIQDEGRFGYASWGINHGGAMDFVAHAIANTLAGNPPSQAVVEIHFPAGEFHFEQPTLVAITGADFGPSVNGKPVSTWKSIVIPAASTLSFTKRKNGMRCYLAIHGTIDVPQWLGSKSTNLKAATGGFDGRRLKSGDMLSIKPGAFNFVDTGSIKVSPWSVNTEGFYEQRGTLHFLWGHESGLLSEHQREQITTQRFVVSSRADRMAIHLEHEALDPVNTELLSSAVATGTMQLLPSGKILVLMTDHQTTGGYPRIGHVISAHLPTLAQAVPGEGFRLRETSLLEAEKSLFSIRRKLVQIQSSVMQKLKEAYDIR